MRRVAAFALPMLAGVCLCALAGETAPPRECVTQGLREPLPAGGGWKPHAVRQRNGAAGFIEVPAQFQVVTESWNRVVAVPYLVYMPEKDRLLMLVGCDYPHHAMVLTSDDQGATWTPPRPVRLDADGKTVPGLGTSLTYLGNGK
ncbi:MAG: exo-alpha-sialidase, partial [Candidatus Hydrogenedentes bacterium]|nr:exo-alpha-sialidase [Candidatus Hydrogenedentota bacterium]